MSRRILWMLCCLIMAAAILTGCKDTAVLKEIVYQDDTNLIDPDQQQVDNNAQNTQEDETLYARKEDSTSDQKRDTKDTLGAEDSTADTTPSASINPGEELDTNDGSSDGNDNTSSQSSNSKKKSSDKSGKSEDPDFDKDKASLDDNENQGNSDGTSDNPSGQGNGSQVTDANGRRVDIPERVDTVTAVGETAMIVEMLGGQGRLLGTSESFKDNTLASQIFSDFSQIQEWWSGSGKNGISASDFRSLIAAAPQLCFIVSGEKTFTNAQIAALENHNITCVTLYPYNTPEHIETNVTLIGQVLGDQSLESGRKDAVTLARTYVRWIQQAESDFSGNHYTDYTLTKYLEDAQKWNSRGSGQYTLLVQHWDDDASVKIYSNESQGLVDTWSGGAGSSDSGYLKSPVSYYMSIAGVVNTAAAESAIENQTNSYCWYVNQWINGSCIVKIQGNYTDYRASGNYTGPLLAEISEDRILVNQMSHLGSDNFPAIIAGSKTIAAKLAVTKLMTSYPYVSDSAGGYYGFTYGTGLEMRSSIIGDYDIYVNPYGLSCWYEGSVEAPLEAYWIAARFGTAGYSMSTLEHKIYDFYNTFYNYQLSDSQIENILEGEYVPTCREE